MNLKRNLLLALAIGFVASQRARAQQTNDEIKDLRQQIEALDQKLKILERRQETREEDAAAKAKETAKTTPVITAGADGFTFRSADTNFVLGLHGVLQVDSRTFFRNHYTRNDDAFLLRRARPILQGTVFRDFDFLFVPDFGGNTVQIFDAYVNYRNRPEFQVQAGKFKSPVGLEALQQDVNTTFNERALATDLVPNRDIGAELHGDFLGGVASYAFGIFNGSPDYSGTTTNTSYQDNKAFEGRVFFQPFKQAGIPALQGLGFGVSGSYEVDRATNASSTGLTSGYMTDGQQKFFTYTNGVFANGPHWRISPQGYYYYGPASVMGEYVISDQEVTKTGGASADLDNRAWEVTGGWILTGENASYSGVTPKYPFDPALGHWGAWQVVGRLARLDVDHAAFPTFADPTTSASEAKAWSAGLNWYLNRNIRVEASYSQTTFDGGNGPKATVTKRPEEVFFTRVQLGF